MSRQRRLLLARHGETEWNALGRLQGHTDIPLNARGRSQARELAARVATAGITTVISSDLERAQQTAEIVAAELGLAPPRTIPALRERAFGVFEGLTRDECKDRYPEAWQAWQAQTSAPPGAEPLADATARMHAILASLAREDPDTALVISHGGVMRLWLVDVIGSTFPPLHNGATYIVEHDGARFSARALTQRRR